jgi:RNA polymerase sigma-70 factor, ECF subfamily
MASASQVLGYLRDHREDELNPSAAGPGTELPNGAQDRNPPPICGTFHSNGQYTGSGGPPPSFEPDGGVVTDQSWTSLVERLQAGDATAMAELYQVFSKGIRFYLCRQVGPQELDDRVHDAFLIVVQSIQKGELRDPRRLMGFVRTIVRRMVAAQIDREVQIRRDTTEVEYSDRIADQRANPEKSFIMRQKINLIREILEVMSDKDREILRRFYVEEQHPDQICSEMNLSITQFRLLKSRAKARFGEEGRKKLQSGTTICEETVRILG